MKKCKLKDKVDKLKKRDIQTPNGVRWIRTKANGKPLTLSDFEKV